MIELLVSMTLLGLLFVLLLGGLRFGSRAWEHSTANADAGDTVRSAQNLLRSEIERACPRRIASAAPPGGPPRVQFSGTQASLRFLAPLPGAAGDRSCANLLVAMRPDGPLRRLSMAFGAAGGDLLRHVQGVEFGYRATDGTWTTDWSGRSELPTAVRLRVTFSKGDVRAWPELFVVPRISAEADCTYDPATKSCRGP